MLDQEGRMNNRVKVLAILPAIIPSTTILVVEPLMYLLNLGEIELRVRLEKLDTRFSDVAWADLIVFCRNTEPAYDFAETALQLGKPYIYELDDNLFELEPDTLAGIYHLAPERIAQLEKYIKQAALVRVYSPVLERRILQLTSKVRAVTPPINLSGIPSVAPTRSSPRVKILFSTSRTVTDNLSQIFMTDLIKILQEQDGNIEVHFWGYKPNQLKGFASVKFHRFMADYQKYMRAIYREGYDIGLAPMLDDIFHNSKTNNKFREYGACWIAGIYSSAEVYAHSVEAGKTGLLVSNEAGSWYRALNMLINDSALRNRIQKEARAFVEKEYVLSAFATSLLKDINQILSTAIPSEDSVKSYTPDLVPAVARQGPVQALLKFAKVPLVLAQKLFRAIRSYGWEVAVRLGLEQIERYIRYFEVRREIKRRQDLDVT